MQADKTDSCLASQQATGLQKAFAGPKDSRGNAIYPAFPFDAGIMDTGRIPGILLSSGSSPVNPTSSSTEFDAERAAWVLASDATARIGDATWTNLSTFSGHNGN